MLRTIYLNLEDDIAKITARLKKERVQEVVLVFPKKSFIFSDSINLRLLKKQADLLGKKVSILTMDEMGQAYAKEAGFPLKFLPRSRPVSGFSDVRRATPPPPTAGPVPEKKATRPLKKLRSAIAPVAVSDNFFAGWNNEDAAIPPRRLRDRVKGAMPQAVTIGSSRIHRRAIFGFVALSLVVILLLVFVILPAADITIYAKTTPVARDIEISLTTQATESDSTRLVMPAVPVSEQFDRKDSLTSTGKKEVGSKAQGKVYILNLTGQTLNLKADTTTLTVGSKQYVFMSDQMGIRPTGNKDADPKQDPNIRSADIVAAEGGGSYNLPAGTRVEITNQVFGSRPQALYAKTLTEITGGNSRFISQVSEEDLRNAQTTLTKAVVDDVRNKLKQKNLILADKAFTVVSPEFAADKTAGAESPSFNGEYKGTLSGLGLDYTVLVQMIRDRIGRTLSGSEHLQDVSQDQATYSVKSLDLAAGTMALTVHYESLALSEIDTSDVVSRISGKTKQEASELILSKPEVDKVEIGLSPAWQETIPRIRQKVKMTVQQK